LSQLKVDTNKPVKLCLNKYLSYNAAVQLGSILNV